MDQLKRKVMAMLGSILLVLTLALTGCAGEPEDVEEGVGPGIEQEEGMGEEGMGEEELEGEE